MESPSKGEQVAKTEFAAPRSSAPSLLSSLLYAPRTGLSAGMDMVMSLPGAFGQGPGILYSGATNAMNVTCEMIKTRIPSLPFGSDWDRKWSWRRFSKFGFGWESFCCTWGKPLM